MISSERFRDLFSFSPEELKETVLFTDGEVTGFSIKKEYPSGIPFKVAKTKDGEIDSVALIHVGFYLDFPNEESQLKNVILKIAPASRYKLKYEGKFHFEYGDNDSPTKESQEKSEKSKSPVPLEERAYVFDIGANKFLFAKNKKETQSPKEIIEKIFKVQVRINKNQWWDLRNFWFKLKILFISRFLVKVVRLFKYFLGLYVRKIAGHKIDNENDVLEKAGMRTVRADSFPEVKLASQASLKKDKQFDIEVFGTKLSRREAFFFLIIIFLYYVGDYLEVRLPGHVFLSSYQQGLFFKTFIIVALIFFIKYFLSFDFSNLIVSRVINKMKDWEWALRARKIDF
jgi:hypothetical protein